jgi:predicted ATPase
MVAELAARHALPKEMVEGVTERTGGVPLFIEEVTRLLLEGGQRALERSALAEAIEHFNRALAHVATLPGTPDLRRQQIKFQVALITPLSRP